MGLPMPDLIRVTPESVATSLPDLPRTVQLAIRYGSKLRRGTLDVTLPDGRRLRLGGVEPGPSAAMTLYNYSFAARLLNGGGLAAVEIGHDQGASAAAILERGGLVSRLATDLAGRPRAILLTGSETTA